jgi:transcription factor C subunit 7
MKRSRDAARVTTVYLIRHGARFDFADKAAWKATCARLGLEASDPSLSALGHKQARQTAAALAGAGIEHILVSPYLRCIQTAQPLAHACSLPLCVEEGLAELAYAPSAVPPASARVRYFPEVDDAYQPLHPPVATPPGGEESGVGYLRRMLRLAAALPERFPGGVVACYSHAASVALVAALTRSDGLDAVGCFACVAVAISPTRRGLDRIGPLKSAAAAAGCKSAPLPL